MDSQPNNNHSAETVKPATYRLYNESGRWIMQVSHFEKDNRMVELDGGLPGHNYSVRCRVCLCAQWEGDGPTYHFLCGNCGERTLFKGVE